MVSRLLIDDPALALEHARAARRRASRISVVRESAGIAAYNAQEWAEALSELRAARRMSGDTSLLPLIADAERGLGRPERAIDIARGEDGRALTDEAATEMRIVESGARVDLGEPEKAIVTLQSENLDPARTGTSAARLFYAYASAFAAAGRRHDAMTWFMNAAAADVDDVTDAEDRLSELADADVATDVTVNDTEPETTLNRASTIGTPTARIDPEVSDTTAPLSSAYDALLFDLDGTLFAGHKPIHGALAAVESVAIPALYVTNNASRRADDVAEHLVNLGFTASPDQVVTSAQSAAALLAQQLAGGATVLVIGTDGLAAEVAEAGLRTTRSADDHPAAVVQGHSPDTGWQELSEAVLAISAGALWVATNTDVTLPSERGMLVGNGSMVAAVASATGRRPQVAGKPEAPLMRDAISRVDASHPLVIGDRLDTDIAGANAVGAHSLLVLTGVSSLADAAIADISSRPTHVASDLSALVAPAAASAIESASGWTVDVGSDAHVAVSSTPSSSAATLPAAILRACWASGLSQSPSFSGRDSSATAALAQLGYSGDC